MTRKEITLTLVPGESPSNCRGLRKVLWWVILWSSFSFVKRNCSRHLLQWYTVDFCSKAYNNKCKKKKCENIGVFKLQTDITWIEKNVLTSTSKSIWLWVLDHLMSGEVLLIGIGILKDFQAVEAQQVTCVFVPGAKVVVHIRIEWRPVFTHLEYTSEVIFIVKWYFTWSNKKIKD